MIETGQRNMESKIKSPSFHLDKWYFDCVSDAGKTLIGYCAELEWKAVEISYASYLAFDGRQAPSSKTSLMRARPPQITERDITWQSDRLSCSGSWQSLIATAFPSLTLYEDNTGSVTWHCLQPLSDANLLLKGEEYSGLGYVERLEMTVAPWRLPIDELHWGRFLSRNAYLVWIEWRGPQPLTIAYLNGEKIENVDISNSGLSWDGGTLIFSEQASLRSGPLIKTAFAKIPGARSLFPKSILNANECKWRSYGRLLYEGTTHTGWAIHEIVRFR